jgi:hypothetical protein
MNNDEIKAKYSEVNNEIEGIGIFDGNRDKALDDARADALETNEILSMYNRGELFTKEVIEREKELARADERKHITISPIEWELEIRKSERKRCIDIVKEILNMNNKLLIDVSPTAKSFLLNRIDTLKLIIFSIQNIKVD